MIEKFLEVVLTPIPAVEVVLTIICLVITFGVGLAVVLGHNEAVYHYRGQLIEDIGMACKREIDAGCFTWNIRYEVFEQVSYERMLLKFWRTFDSFWTPEEHATMTGPCQHEADLEVQARRKMMRLV